jgi:hypothetical protein
LSWFSVDETSLKGEVVKKLAALRKAQKAATEAKAAFEEEINVFGGSFDEYVPEGSATGVTVAVRRALVAVAGLSLALPLPVASRRQ